MRKIVPLLIVILFAALAVSCQKADSNKLSVSGTTWSRSYDDGSQILEFTSDTDCRVYQTDASGNIDGSPSVSTYTITDNVINFKQPDKGTFGFVDMVFVLLPVSADTYGFLSATVSNNIMTVTASDTYTSFKYEDGKLVDMPTTEKSQRTFTFMKK